VGLKCSISSQAIVQFLLAKTVQSLWRGFIIYQSYFTLHLGWSLVDFFCLVCDLPIVVCSTN